MTALSFRHLGIFGNFPIAQSKITPYTDSVKNFYIFGLIIFVCIGALVIFVVFVSGIKKSFSNPPPPQISAQAQDLKRQQKKIAEEAEDQRKILMENVKDRIKDNRRF